MEKYQMCFCNPTTYVLITPARNEAEFIEMTIRSVVAQSVRPLKWVIVSDGSTDDTDAIVQRYATEHAWIELLRMPPKQERDFAGKVRAFNAGYARVSGLQFHAVGSLDADISFDSDYFAFLLQKLDQNRKLGLVGTPFQEESGQTYDYRFVNIEHVSGACQLFRRDCFKEIGGYLPVKGGSIDHIAVISARMRGWKTRTFTEKLCLHHRQLGTAQEKVLRARFNYGVKDYRIGNHALWQVLRTFYQMTQKPFVVGGVALAVGYCWAAICRYERPVSSEFMSFHRREQKLRIIRLFLRNKTTLVSHNHQETVPEIPA
jgi:glycosyltransferase involved in cell wall biosynthesis